MMIPVSRAAPCFPSWVNHRFPFPPRPGGIRRAALDSSSSTLAFCSEKAGSSREPHEHGKPFQSYRPTPAPHFGFGHDSRPLSSPFSSSARIQLRGSMKKCWQDDDDAAAEASTPSRGLCGTIKGAVARMRRHFLQRSFLSGVGAEDEDDESDGLVWGDAAASSSNQSCEGACPTAMLSLAARWYSHRW